MMSEETTKQIDKEYISPSNPCFHLIIRLQQQYQTRTIQYQSSTSNTAVNTNKTSSSPTQPTCLATVTDHLTMPSPRLRTTSFTVRDRNSLTTSLALTRRRRYQNTKRDSAWNPSACTQALVISVGNAKPNESYESWRKYWSISIQVARVCLAYLSFDAFEDGPCSNDESLSQRLQQYRFLDYASHHWGIHVRTSELNDDQGLIQRFLGDGRKLSASVQILHTSRHRTKGGYDRFPKRVTPLHVAAYWGLPRILTVLLC
ncbi:hypothetical protein VTI74DRAFT_183 [Chaetomium olivicolor]